MLGISEVLLRREEEMIMSSSLQEPSLLLKGRVTTNAERQIGNDVTQHFAQCCSVSKFTNVVAGDDDSHLISLSQNCGTEIIHGSKKSH